MRTYDTYKDSGISWLGQIPSHWELKTLRNFLIPFSLKGFPELQMLSVTREQGVILRDMERESNHNVIPEDLSGYKVVHRGQFVINKMKSWQGSYGVSKFEGIVSPAYFVYDLNIANKDFFHIALRSRAYIPFFMQFSKGIRVDQWDLSPIALKSIPFVLPTPSEQEAIVAYLDSATAEIDKAIASQQRMVELLQERKQIIINQAVTQGLNPDAPMKPTNIDWLPKIPSHWDLRRLKYLLKSPLQYGANESPESTDTNLPRYIRITDIKDNGKLNDDSFVSLSWEKAKDYLLQKGDILFARSGATVGKTYLFEEQYSSCFAGYLIKARCNDGLLPEFLYIFTKSGVYDKWKESIFIKSTIQNIGADKYSNLPVPFPPYDEQKAIVEYIESTISPVNSAISRCEHIIALLTERKQILINDVVTGKIKVS